MDPESIHYMLRYQDYEQLVELFDENDLVINYKVMKNADQSYFIGDFIKYQRHFNTHFGQIEEIVSLQLVDEKLLPLIKIKVLLTINELIEYVKDSKALRKYSDQDLFCTEEYKWIHFGEIQNKIQTNNTNNQQTIYKIIENWEHLKHCNLHQKKVQYCFCGQPDQQEQEWVQCEQCQNWIHFQCSNLTPSQLQKIANLKFICKICKLK